MTIKVAANTIIASHLSNVSTAPLSVFFLFPFFFFFFLSCIDNLVQLITLRRTYSNPQRHNIS
jgi:hypothetical protein